MRRDPRYRFLINRNPNNQEVHDLDNEKTGPQQCQIDEIVDRDYLIATTIAGLEQWLNNNRAYDGCRYCLPHYHRN